MPTPSPPRRELGIVEVVSEGLEQHEQGVQAALRIRGEKYVFRRILHMTSEDRDILERFAARVRARFPEAQIFAFGSRARGEGTWESDLDVCIVLDAPGSRSVKDWIGDVAWTVGYPHHRILTTLVLDRSAFDDGPLSASPLVDAIRREGVAA